MPWWRLIIPSAGIEKISSSMTRFPTEIPRSARIWRSERRALALFTFGTSTTGNPNSRPSSCSERLYAAARADPGSRGRSWSHTRKTAMAAPRPQARKLTTAVGGGPHVDDRAYHVHLG